MRNVTKMASVAKKWDSKESGTLGAEAGAKTTCGSTSPNLLLLRFQDVWTTLAAITCPSGASQASPAQCQASSQAVVIPPEVKEDSRCPAEGMWRCGRNPSSPWKALQGSRAGSDLCGFALPSSSEQKDPRDAF